MYMSNNLIGKKKTCRCQKRKSKRKKIFKMFVCRLLHNKQLASIVFQLIDGGKEEKYGLIGYKRKQTRI